jgi:hypothetical protein
MDPTAAALVKAGKARSATFRRLTETTEESDLVVYVRTTRLAYPGQLQFGVASAGVRYLWIFIGATGTDNDVLPWLAHELYHAVEISGAPEVRTQATLVQFYKRIGDWAEQRPGSITLETDAAKKVQATVLRELLR